MDFENFLNSPKKIQIHWRSLDAREKGDSTNVVMCFRCTTFEFSYHMYILATKAQAKIKIY